MTRKLQNIPLLGKNDILLYYVNIARLILTANESQSREHSKYVKIIVDDFSRVFMRLGKDKIISFTFPFNLINGELYINDISIDNYVLAVFESILRKSLNEKVSFYDALCEKIMIMSFLNMMMNSS